MGVPENPPAFPLPDGADIMGRDGMTLRDYFAGAVLSGAAAVNVPLNVSSDARQHEIDGALREYWGCAARAAYIAADAMLSARTVQS